MTRSTSARARALLLGAASCLSLAAGPALAQSAAPADPLSVNLLKLLVKQKVITQEAADELLAEARRQTAQPPLPAAAPVPAGDALAALDTAATAVAEAQARLRAAQTAQTVPAAARADAPLQTAQASDLPPPAAGATRIPYVPEPVRKQIRDEVRDEVIQLAKAENWAQPNAIPDWTRRVAIHGDLRVRESNDMYSSDNADDIINWAAFNANGPTDVNPDTNLGLQVPVLNTRRTRALQFSIRARLEVEAQPASWITANIRLASGSSNSPVSTTQLLGGGLSKKNVWLDRAYIGLHPIKGIDAAMGRIPNPFFSTDMVYDTDLNFDGGAIRGEYAIWPSAGLSVFGVGGAFLTDYQDADFPTASLSSSKAASRRKWLFAGQVGGAWENDIVRWRTGLAYYSFRGAQGLLSTPCNPVVMSQCSTDFSRPAFMQKGNTVFLIRQIVDDPELKENTPRPQFAGLVFPFHVLNLTSTVDVKLSGGTHFELTGDYARNLAYKFSDACRYGVLGMPWSNIVNVDNICDGAPGAPRIHSGPNAWMVRASYGHPNPSRWGEWKFTAGYKHLAGDSVLDAYTDSDFHLGGTNAKGYFLLGTVGIATNTDLQFRWFSANEVTGPNMAIDVGQIEINTRF